MTEDERPERIAIDAPFQFGFQFGCGFWLAGLLAAIAFTILFVKPW